MLIKQKEFPCSNASSYTWNMKGFPPQCLEKRNLKKYPNPRLLVPKTCVKEKSWPNQNENEYQVNLKKSSKEERSKSYLPWVFKENKGQGLQKKEVQELKSPKIKEDKFQKELAKQKVKGGKSLLAKVKGVVPHCTSPIC